MSDPNVPTNPERRGAARGEAPSTWKVLGLHINRQTEFIALAAFMLSIGGVMWQVVNIARGAVVRLFPSDQIVLVSADKLDRNYPGQPDLLLVVATLSYVNEGNAQQNAIVRREYIHFTIGGRPIEQRWYEFGTADIQGGNPTFTRKSESRPFPVNAGAAESHETLFSAWEVDCDQIAGRCDPRQNFVTWDDFIKAIKTSNRLTFTTGADVYGKGSVEATCVVRLRDWEIKALENDRWLAAVCQDVATSNQSPRQTQPQPVVPGAPK
jgi:hypothetical protein